MFVDSVEPEFYPNSNVFVNKADERDFKSLQSLEAGYAVVNEYLIIENPSLLPKEFNLSKLKAIHYHLFKDLYDWAGKPRSYDMRKDNNEFTPAKDLPKYESVVFSRAEDVLDLIEPEHEILAEKLVRCLGILNIYHMFPEG